MWARLGESYDNRPPVARARPPSWIVIGGARPGGLTPCPLPHDTNLSHLEKHCLFSICYGNRIVAVNLRCASHMLSPLPASFCSPCSANHRANCYWQPLLRASVDMLIGISRLLLVSFLILSWLTFNCTYCHSVLKSRRCVMYVNKN